MSHPLRPKEDYVLICEGQRDVPLLTSLFENHASDILVFYANGIDNVRPLANICYPSVYVVDRDFNLSFDEAKDTLQSQQRFTCWAKHDIESYFLYSDWLLNGLNEIHKSFTADPPHSFPSSHDEIEGDILNIAAGLVADHAGRKLLRELSKRIEPLYDFVLKPQRGQVRSGAEASDRAVWETVIEAERLRVLERFETSGVATEFSQSHVTDRYSELVEEYTAFAKTLDTVRNEFSGKRIFQALAVQWGVRSPKRDSRLRPWELLRSVTTEISINYAKTLSNLSDDVRLGDFGKLASKITGRLV